MVFQAGVDLRTTVHLDTKKKEVKRVDQKNGIGHKVPMPR